MQQEHPHADGDNMKSKSLLIQISQGLKRNLNVTVLNDENVMK